MAEPQAVESDPARPAGDAEPRAVRILFVGDIVGGIGRETLLDCLPVLRERHDPTFVVVNGENAAGGLGITPKNADQLFAAGVDAITLGNHTYHRREIYPYLDSHDRIVRPANFLRSQPGRGTTVVEHDGVRLGVVNISGNLYLRAGRSAFTEIEAALGELGEVDHVLVDVHAEATSEKVAMGWHLDGRVTAVVGTHTHVPDGRRARAARRDRLHHRRRHDRPARRRDRRQTRAGDRVAAHADARALRDLERGPVADGRADQLLKTASGGLDRATADASSGFALSAGPA